MYFSKEKEVSVKVLACIICSLVLASSASVSLENEAQVYSDFCRRLESTSFISGLTTKTTVKFTNGKFQDGSPIGATINWMYQHPNQGRLAEFRNNGLYAEHAHDGSQRISFNPGYPAKVEQDDGQPVFARPYGFEAFFVPGPERLWREVDKATVEGPLVKVSLRRTDTMYVHPIREDELDLYFDRSTRLPTRFEYRVYDNWERNPVLITKTTGDFRNLELKGQRGTPTVKKAFFTQRIKELEAHARGTKS